MESNEISKFRIELGKKINDLRKERGETQNQLKDVVGVSKREMINLWESGINPVKAEHLHRIATHYNVSVDWLLGLYPHRSLSANAKEAAAYTGLSDTAVKRLHGVCHRVKAGRASGAPSSDDEMRLAAINLLLESDLSLLGDIYKYVYGGFDSFVIEVEGKKEPFNSDSIGIRDKDGKPFNIDAKSMSDIFLLKIQEGFRKLQNRIKEGAENG